MTTEIKRLELESVGGKFNVWAYPSNGGQPIEFVGKENRLDDVQVFGVTNFGGKKTAVIECIGEFGVFETEDGKTIARFICRSE